MIAPRTRGDVRWFLLCVCLLPLVACSNEGESRTVVPDVSLAGDGAPAPTPPVTAIPVTTSSLPAASTSTPDVTSTVAEGSATTQPVVSDEPVDPTNIYALAGARAIAARANENDLGELDAEGAAEALLEAIEAAYEIEYPSVVTYLDVTQDEAGNLVVVTEDESQTQVGTAYVCIVDGTAIAGERTCATPGN